MRTAIAAYYGMVSFLDDNVGRVLGALEDTGLADDTRVVYTSDHGDNLGTRSFWGKSTMYEESVGVPLVMRGAGVPRGQRVATPVSLVDGYQTLIEAIGERLERDRARRAARPFAAADRATASGRGAPCCPSTTRSPRSPACS